MVSSGCPQQRLSVAGSHECGAASLLTPHITMGGGGGGGGGEGGGMHCDSVGHKSKGGQATISQCYVEAKQQGYDRSNKEQPGPRVRKRQLIAVGWLYRTLLES